MFFDIRLTGSGCEVSLIGWSLIADVHASKGAIRMKKFGIAMCVVAAAMFLSASAFPQGEKQGQGQVTVTILPKHDGDQAPTVSAQDLSIKVNGKDAKVSNFESLRSATDVIELVVLIDSSARTSLGRQFEDIAQFVNTLPPNVRATVGYMQNGNSNLTGPFTTDHAAILRGLHLPIGGAGVDSSPYFCLSDLAKRWPSRDTNVRREVVMVTDGVDQYNRRYDPDDPYVQAAINDAVRARMVIYTIYWRSEGRADNTQYANNAGQNLMLSVAQATGGKSFWEGAGNPVSFQPYFEELTRRFKNQYELSFVVPMNGKPQIEQFKLKFKSPGEEVDSPQQVFVARPGVAQD
jgi:hypothetical protein